VYCRVAELETSPASSSSLHQFRDQGLGFRV